MSFFFLFFLCTHCRGLGVLSALTISVLKKRQTDREKHHFGWKLVRNWLEIGGKHGSGIYSWKLVENWLESGRKTECMELLIGGNGLKTGWKTGRKLVGKWKKL